MRIVRNQGGFIKPLLTLAVLVLGLYVAYQFGVPYYRYSMFRSEAKEITRLGIGDVQKIKTQVYETAQEFKIPIEENDILVTRKPNLTLVRTAWSVDVDILGVYQKTLNFQVAIEE